MLRSGLALARRGGLSALTVRAVAIHAKVNLGSFVYHFGTREAFIEELVERWYAPVWSRLQSAAATHQPPIERFRDVVLQLFDWIAANGPFLGHLLVDAFAGERAVLRFLRTMAMRHPVLIMQVIREAQAAGQIVRGEPLHLLMFTMSAIGLPVLFARGVSAGQILPDEMERSLVAFATSRRHAEKRLEWVLAGIGTGRIVRK